MVGDPVGDFIIRIKNASAVGKDVVSAPYSKFRQAIADVLKQKGYLTSVEAKGKSAQKVLEVGLRYDKAGKSALHGIKRVSRPGRRLYVGANEINPVKYGKGSLIISTPKGVLTDEEARKERVGGEALFKIW
ncbi:MAG: 30S ribosomal protein S8 [Candidatus Pacebacteria bacterium]|nr:30S ribosomal protein S8 [Candidatus Paceibacterota bacterium]